MESIKDKVAIVGMGCTKFGELWEKSTSDLMVEAANEAVADAGIELKDIQAAWLGTCFSGEVGTALSVPLRLPHIPVTRVENRCCTGADAIRNAAYGIASGAYDVVLALGVEKQKDTGFSGTSMGQAEPHPVFYHRTALSTFALRATAYFDRWGISAEEGKVMMARIAVKARRQGVLSPKAHFQKIKALALASGPGADYGSDEFDLSHFEEVRHAAQSAYVQAGIKDPLAEIDLAQCHDCFTITEAILYEDLGFCPKGQAREFIRDGIFDIGGSLPMNTDGGLLAFGHPLGASGIRQACEAYLQFQGKAQERQLKDPKIALCENFGGGYGAWSAVVNMYGRADT